MVCKNERINYFKTPQIQILHFVRVILLPGNIKRVSQGLRHSSGASSSQEFPWDTQIISIRPGSTPEQRKSFYQSVLHNIKEKETKP